MRQVPGTILVNILDSWILPANKPVIQFYISATWIVIGNSKPRGKTLTFMWICSVVRAALLIRTRCARQISEFSWGLKNRHSVSRETCIKFDVNIIFIYQLHRKQRRLVIDSNWLHSPKSSKMTNKWPHIYWELNRLTWLNSVLFNSRIICAICRWVLVQK